jgi:hypothetical protein
MLNSANPQPRQQTPLSENLPPQQTPGLFSVSLGPHRDFRAGKTASKIRKGASRPKPDDNLTSLILIGVTLLT